MHGTVGVAGALPTSTDRKDNSGDQWNRRDQSHPLMDFQHVRRLSSSACSFAFEPKGSPSPEASA